MTAFFRARRSPLKTVPFRRWMGHDHKTLPDFFLLNSGCIGSRIEERHGAFLFLLQGYPPPSTGFPALRAFGFISASNTAIRFLAASIRNL